MAPMQSEMTLSSHQCIITLRVKWPEVILHVYIVDFFLNLHPKNCTCLDLLYIEMTCSTVSAIFMEQKRQISVPSLFNVSVACLHST